jgi:predicted PurR-regulated permease PerM
MAHDRTKQLTINWAKQRDIPFAILGWIGVIAVIIWALSYVDKSLILIAVAAFFAYALSPVVSFFSRFLPRFVAITLVYLIVLGGLGLLLYLVILSATEQFSSLARTFNTLVISHNNRPTPLMLSLERLGVTQEQLALVGQQFAGQVETLTGQIIPLVSSFVFSLIDTILVAIVSVYLLVDGTRFKTWLLTNTPRSYRGHLSFFLATLQRVVGGYIRGQVLLALFIGVLVGVGLSLFHVPYALLLGVLAFLLEFIPILGVFISGALAVLLALTQGWLVALFVAVYFIIIHIVEGDILGPRVVGRALGLHPLISIIALLIGTELFGITGALFAAPVAGILQAIVIAGWSELKVVYPQSFGTTGLAAKEKKEHR